MDTRLCRNGHPYSGHRCNVCRRAADLMRRRAAGIGELLGIRALVPLGDTQWMQRAACLRHDPDLWFPDGVGAIAAGHARDAKAVCQWCPVRLECLQQAVTVGERFGIWGGVSAKDLPSPRTPPGGVRRCACGRFLRMGETDCGGCES